MKSVKAVQVVATGLAAVSLSNSEAFAGASDLQVENGTDVTAVAFDKAIYSGCDLPANRDYHALLSVFEGDVDGQYKFSGCGTAI